MKIFKPLFICGALALSFTGYAQWNRHKGKDDEDRTINYELKRNEPTKSGLYGVVINPVYLDGNKLNLNIGGGVEFFYTFKSDLRISGGYHFAYIDNLTNYGHTDAPGGDADNYGTAVKTYRSKRYGILVSPTIKKWEKEGSYHITLGSAGYRTIAVTRVHGTILRSLTGRFGYQVDDRIISSADGAPFITTTPEYEYHYEGDTYTLSPTNIYESTTRMRTDMAIIGIGYTTFRDIKITLDDDQYTGRREEKSQTDLFFDVMYANKISLQDMLYYHSLHNYTQEYKHLRQRLDLSATPLSKMGFRAGLQVLSMYRPNFGTKFLLEGGARPGLKGGKMTNLYAQFTLGFVFGGRIARSQE